MKITRLKRTKNGLRVNIEVDGKFRLAVEENTLVKFGLYIGKETTEEEIEVLTETDITEYGYRIALNYIEKRLRSKKEVSDYLRKKLKAKDEDVPNENLTEIYGQCIVKVINRLCEQKYIDDYEFTKFLIASKLKRKNKSRKELIQNILHYGVEKEIYEEALKDEYEENTELATIKSLIAKKLETSKFKALGKREKEQKLYEFLSRKGFEWDMIKSVTNDVLNQ